MTAAAADHDRDAAPERGRGRPIKGRRALDSLPSKARTTGAAAAARSRLVRRLRLALPIVALALIATFILNSQNNGVDNAFLEDFEDLTAAAGDRRMVNPRFAGIDDKGKPFEIEAEWAIQDPGVDEVVELENPRAVQGEGSESTIVTAERGVYKSEANILELEDNVTLEHTIGQDTYILRAPAATVLMKDEIVTSNVGVGGEGPDGGALRADRMKAYNSEGRVVFEGNVSMRIYPKSTNRPAQDDADGPPPLKDVEINEPQ